MQAGLSWVIPLSWTRLGWSYLGVTHEPADSCWVSLGSADCWPVTSILHHMASHPPSFPWYQHPPKKWEGKPNEKVFGEFLPLSQLLASHWPKQVTWSNPASVWKDTGRPKQIEAFIVLTISEEGILKMKIWMIFVHCVLHKATMSGFFKVF